MTALLSRRDDRCLSDLTMDRFLLGETSDSDEGRMLERHLAWCSNCLARVQSLRTLYAHADMPEVTDQPAPVPTPGPMPAQRADAVSGVLELVLMRDGLLIGTEVFTPGTWCVGSGPRANLKLDAKGVAAEHAKLSFRNDRVIIERLQGPVLVNGYRVERSEVRPIDEIIVGPFVIRSRVISGRWSEESAPPSKLAVTRPIRALPVVEVEDETQLVTVPAQAAPVAPVAPAGAVAALRLDLYWGDALQASELVAGNVPTSAFPAFAPGREPSAAAVAGGYRLCVPGARVEVLRNGNWINAGDELLLADGERARVIDGALRLEARLQVAPALVPPKPKTEFLRGGFVPALSFLMLGLFVFAGVASGMEPEDSFEPKSTAKLSVYMVPPPPKTKIEVPKNTAPERGDVQPKSPVKRTPAAAPPAKNPPPHLAGLAGMSKVMEQINKLKNSTLPTGPGKGAKQPDLFAGLGKIGGKNGVGFGLGPDSATGIGATGLKGTGEMKAGRTGKGRVGGTLVGPVSRDAVALKGTIDRDAVAKVINEHLAEVSACYERGLLTHPGLNGKLGYEWVIGLGGEVTSVKMKAGTMKDAGVASCVGNAIKKWKFPKPRGGQVTISYPFMFQARDF
ncbi:MAG: AgmX/PglI C-terminal domain-containing protein [Archangium sp.]